MAAIAALTEVAVVEARDETEQSLRGSFLEELLTRADLDPADVRAPGRPARLRPGGGLRGALRRPRRRAARAGWWRRSRPSCPGALAQTVDGKVYALLPGPPDPARRVATRLGRHADRRAVVATAARRPTRAARSRRPSWCWA